MIINITDIKQLGEIPRRMKAEYKEVVGRSLWQETSKIMNESQDECPVEFGLLKASGYVGDPYTVGNTTEIMLGYSQYYAIFVHEILDNYHAPPTKAKFLEDPVNRALPTFAADLQRRINYEWGLY